MCPVSSHCLAFAQGRQAELPHKKPKKTNPTKHTFMVIPSYQGSVLLQKRPASGIWGGLWGFVEADEQTLNSVIVQLACTEANQQELEAFRHTFSHFHLEIRPILLQLPHAPVQSVQEDTMMWYNLEQGSQVGLAAPTVKILNQLKTDYL